MKKQLLRFGPWLVLLVAGTIATPRYANTAPAPEPHPHIRAAANELREAREELRTAAHDFCGHRAEALEKTNEPCVSFNSLWPVIVAERYRVAS